MKICYLIQTHKNPEQLYRLVKTIKKSSANTCIVISHDFMSCSLDLSTLCELPEVYVIRKPSTGERGDFSLVRAYLAAVDWLVSCQVEFDWLINLTGQDYPTQPLPFIENFFAHTKYDGFLQHFQIFSEQCPWGIQEGRDRYFYQYWRLSKKLSPLQRALVKPLRLAVNNIQSYIRVKSTYGTMLGVKSLNTPFTENFVCYGGSYFHILSRSCVEFLKDFSNQNPDLLKYYKRTCISDESIFQTVLANSKKFSLCNDNKRYINFSGSQYGHPHIVKSEDYSKITKDNVFFARKFDPSQDSRILDMLDARILKGS